jgi:peptidoglycan/LPS O-acetylase OafA/YrhL
MGFIWFKIAFVDDARSIPPMLIALFLLITFGASVGLYCWVEKPGRSWLGGIVRPRREQLQPRRL